MTKEDEVKKEEFIDQMAMEWIKGQLSSFIWRGDIKVDWPELAREQLIEPSYQYANIMWEERKKYL